MTDDSAWLSSVPEEARSHQGSRAGVVSRVLAALIDLAVLFLMLGSGYLALAGLLFVIDPVTFEFPAPPRGALLAVAGVVLDPRPAD